MLTISELIAEYISYTEEQSWFEFKDGWYEPDGIGEYISSLSNAAAMLGKEEGFLIWGIHNSTHELTDIIRMSKMNLWSTIWRGMSHPESIFALKKT